MKRRRHGPIGTYSPRARGRRLELEYPGPFERRDPANYHRQSLIMTWRCSPCREWTLYGSYALGRCNRCGTTPQRDSRHAGA